MRPARSMSWWLMTSASAGVSLTVLRGYWESLIAGASGRDKKGWHLNSRPPDKMRPSDVRSAASPPGVITVESLEDRGARNPGSRRARPGRPQATPQGHLSPAEPHDHGVPVL